MSSRFRNPIGRVIAAVAALVLAVGVVVAGAGTAWAEAGDVTVAPAGSQSLTNVTKQTEITDKVITIRTPADTAGVVSGSESQTFTYHIYKIFDATGSGEGASRTVAYTNPNEGLGLPIYDGENETSSNYAFANDGSNVAFYRKAESGAWEKDTSAGAQLPASMIQKLGTLTSSFTDIGTVTVTGTGQTARVQVGGYGYYYVTSTTGSVVAINTLNPSAEIGDKNEVPSVDKTITSVSDASTGSVAQDKKSATAKIGDTVNFSVVIHAKAGTEGLELHDSLSNGLTLSGTEPASVIDSTNATGGHTKVTFTKANDIDSSSTLGQYAVTKFQATSTSESDTTGEDIFIKFGGTFATDTDITVTYSAVLNSNAVVGGDGNPNSATIKYGHSSSITSTTSETKTYTYDFDLVKTGSGDNDEDKRVLNGAEFQLYKGTAGTGDSVTKNGDAIQFVKLSKDADQSFNAYRVATQAEIDDSNTETVTTIPAGYVRFVGLGNGTYALEETKAPEGYNKLTAPVKVTIASANVEATVTGSADSNTLTYQSGNYRVENKTGAELPSTGGMGTTAFYVVGGLLVVGAIAYLVHRRKANANA